MGKVYGYCRVSTKGQLENNSLQQQEEEIKSRYEECTIFREAYTGTKTDRPIFNEMILKLEKGDTLVVTKLDRLARNTIEGIEIIQELYQKGIAVHVLNVGLLENTTMGKFFITTLLAVAEMERNTIIRSEEHTSELQSRQYLVCRLLLEKKQSTPYYPIAFIHMLSARRFDHTIPLLT